ncbi:MAG TPA: hypothetical protein VKB93_09425 [Thermoanaerobaculia bacterium]|nr:hypothetical protein [Thermoanaerobaculia bacterium]
MFRTLLTLLALAPPALATALTVHRPDGTPVPDAQVCRFAAADRENPYKRWFASQDVVCGGEWGKGLWNVFARTSDGVSAMPVLVEGNAPPITLTLEKAATVIAALPEKRRGVIYVPRRGSAFPVEARTIVPAEEELWLIVLDRTTPVAVVTIPPLAASAERSVDARNASEASVLAWVQVPEADRSAVANATGLLTPGIRAVAGVVTREAGPLPAPSQLGGAFVRMREVPEGSAELRIEGRGWVRERHTVKVQPGLTLVAQPLRLRAAGILTVHWSTAEDLVALDRGLGACNASDSTPLVVVAISSCPQPRANPDACSLVREETFDPAPRMGFVTLDDLAPGAYRAEMRFGKLPPASGSADVVPLRPRDLYLTAMYRELSGHVTHGGEPLGEEVQLKFPEGYGFAPAETDQYHAVLLGKYGALPPDSQVTVAACDGNPKAIVLTDRTVRMSGSLDLDIPANQLTLNVTDTFTREALTGATVQYEVMSQSTTRAVLQGTLTTGGDGSVTMKAVPLRELRLSVRLSGYQKQELERFSLTAREEKTIDVQLVPLRGTRGQIVSERPFESGVVVWYSDRGRETERADLAADGTFVYSTWHAPEETMTVVSASHPLWVLRSPAIGRRESIALRFPAAPAREFDVRAAASWHVGIEIGGLRVPQPLFVLHQSLRQVGRDVGMVSPAKPLHVFALLATSPIDVLLTSPAEEIARQRLAPEATVVVFTR